MTSSVNSVVPAWPTRSGVRTPAAPPRRGGVDHRGLIPDLGMALGGGAHPLLEHPLVNRPPRPLRPAVHAAAQLLGRSECIFGHRPAMRAPDRLGAVRDLIAAGCLPPLLRAVRIADGHPADGD